MNKKLCIESLNPKNLSETDLKQIVEIEKDMWAHGIGEYVKCNCCQKIYSKQDIFGHLSKDIFLETVSQIEKILGLKEITCPICNGDTEFIYNEEDYIDEVRGRYNNSLKSFLVCMRDKEGSIIGYEDGYIDDFDNIYRREFEKYYGFIGKDRLIIEIEKFLGRKLPEEILLCCSVGTTQKYAGFIAFYNLMYNFFSHISNNLKGKEILGLYEAVVGGLPHGIYHVCGTSRIGIPESNLYKDIMEISDVYKSDIFIHEDVINSVLFNLGVDGKSFMRKNLKKIKNVQNKLTK